MKKTVLALFFFLCNAFLFLSASGPVQAACGAGQIDLLDYMGPDSIKNYDLRYCGPNGGGSEPISVSRETINVEGSPRDGFLINKGSNYEAYFFDSNSIYFYEDISWDETCPGGEEAFYRVFTPGGGPGGKIPRCIAVGGSFSSPQQIKAYSEAGYSGPGTQATICDDSYGPTTISATIESAVGNPNAPDIPGVPPEDTIVMTNVGGAGAGEEKFYTKGYGLTAFRAVNGSGQVVFQSSFYLDGVSTSEPQLSCSSDSGYNLSKYPLYDLDPNDYYIQPLAGVGDPAKSPEEQLSTIRGDLAGQGYQAHCAAKEMTIKPEYDTASKIDKYFDLFPAGVKILDTESNLTLNYQNSGYPLFRDTDGIKFLTTSIEEYFGFRDIYEDDSSLTEINSAASESLLSESQKCKGALKNLRAMDWMCTLKQLDKAECAVLRNKVPGTDMTLNDFQENVYNPIVTDLESRKNRDSLHYLFGGITKFCDALMEDAVDESLSNRQDLVDFKNELLNIPLYQERTYRLAFIVAAIEQKPALGAIPPIFNFFAGSNTQAEPKHEVLIAAFKIPDIATNKGGLENSGGIDFDDPLIYTRNSLLLRKDSEELKSEGDDLREERSVRAAQNRTDPIDCYNSTVINPVDGSTTELIFPEGFGSISCKSPLGKAVVDIINADSPSCDDEIIVEDSQIIAEITGVVPPPADAPSRLYQPQFGNVLLNQMFFNDVTHPGNAPEIARRDDLHSIFHLTKENWSARGGDTTAQFYIVYPFGYDYDTVVDTLSSTFFTSEQKKLVENDPAFEHERFPIHNDGLAFDGDSDRFIYTDPNTCRLETDPTTGLPITVCDDTSVTIRVESEETPSVSVFGAKLGFWMRKIQQAFNPLFSEAHNYISSCKTTEEFLLGRCLVDGSVVNNRYACKDLDKKQIEVYEYKEVAGKVCDAANANRPLDIPEDKWRQLVWGILQTEGGSYLRAVRAGKKTTDCGPINSCGAVGPMQIINGQCATDACPAAKGIVRTGDFCSLDGSLQWAVGYLRGLIETAKTVNPAARTDVDALLHTLAGKYHGLPNDQLVSSGGKHCVGAPTKLKGKDIGICGPTSNLNYCECVMRYDNPKYQSFNHPSCN